MNYEITQELAKSGHQLAVLLGTQHDMLDAASLFQRMAGQLEVLAAVLREKTKQCEQLAEECAALKAGVKYFSYSEMAGFEEHSTADLAQKSADADLAGERDEASSEGWSEETDTICWGVILQKAAENKFEKPSEENGWIGWSDYALLPNIEIPATDAFLREVRAQGVEMLAAYCQKRRNEMMKTEPNEYATNQAIAATRRAGELALWFAAQLRKGGDA
ncbi:hypothetical protein SMC27_000313 [Cronobacter malonaticus]|nr:hypothetical protein [Cronobacter malonaticus]